MMDGSEEMQALGLRERRAARRWLRQHVNEVRKDLGLPTVEQERPAWLRLMLVNLTAEFGKAMVALRKAMQ